MKKFFIKKTIIILIKIKIEIKILTNINLLNYIN